MGRMIDADELITAFPCGETVRTESVRATIKHMPTIEERKTGKWIIRETAFEDTEAKCSNCGFVTLVNEPENGLHMVSDLLFCPRCGSFNAMMEGEQP